MTPQTPPWSWARAVAARDDDTHATRVRRCDSVEHLRAAVAYEATERAVTRSDRVARINQRIAEVNE